MSAYYLTFVSGESVYRFPVLTQVISGQSMRDMISKYRLFPFNEQSQIWLEGETGSAHLFTAGSVAVLRPNNEELDLVTDRWVPHYDEDLDKIIAALDVMTIEKPIFVINHPNNDTLT